MSVIIPLREGPKLASMFNELEDAYNPQKYVLGFHDPKKSFRVRKSWNKLLFVYNTATAQCCSLMYAMGSFISAHIDLVAWTSR